MKIHHINFSLKIFLVFFLVLTINQSYFFFKFESYNHQEKTMDINSSSNAENKSIILMIGDGMGFEHLKLARWVELGKFDRFLLERLPLHLNVNRQLRK